MPWQLKNHLKNAVLMINLSTRLCNLHSHTRVWATQRQSSSLSSYTKEFLKKKNKRGVPWLGRVAFSSQCGSFGRALAFKPEPEKIFTTRHTPNNFWLALGFSGQPRDDLLFFFDPLSGRECWYGNVSMCSIWECGSQAKQLCPFEGQHRMRSKEASTARWSAPLQ